MFTSVLPEGFALDYTSPDATGGLHTFCGVPADTRGAICPNCQQPLLRYLELDLADPLLAGLRGVPNRLPLLSCWTCRIAQAPFYYRVTTGAVEILEYGAGRDDLPPNEEPFPYAAYPVGFPMARARLTPLSPDVQATIQRINDGTITGPERFRGPGVPAHQIGGEPRLMQGDYHLFDPEVATCPDCKALMPFLAAFGDSCLDPRGFVGNSFTQMIYSICLHHNVVSAHQACD